MNFNKHFDIRQGQLHAFLSASKSSWVNYDEDKLISSFEKYQATQRGTELHALAYDLIRLKVKLPKARLALNQYVNDGIGYLMTPEQPLVYSANCFGTADCISFRDNFLRIHDLKTGVTPVHMTQLEIYSALFCLEYDEDPKKINTELRIYQGEEIIVHIPDPKDIKDIMSKIVRFDRRIEKRKQETED